MMKMYFVIHFSVCIFLKGSEFSRFGGGLSLLGLSFPDTRRFMPSKLTLLLWFLAYSSCILLSFSKKVPEIISSVHSFLAHTVNSSIILNF